MRFLKPIIVGIEAGHSVFSGVLGVRTRSRSTQAAHLPYEVHTLVVVAVGSTFATVGI